ncbi:hypothetical protein BGZ70_009473 [Mortierella alpina]|uniref:Uncharacterized protein n=1 Tax=Mortierella alpina TaxID=64518 RepID=A0A9P6J197_MORAP|nr:hypothetical protein BGZ70_009473 [Mortierella alpina]
MSKALDPLRRLVVQFNARFAQLKAIPTNIPPAPPHLHHAPPPFVKPLPYFGQFQVKVPLPYHKDGPVLLAHLNKQLNTLARSVFVPEPARVAAVDYACRSVGRPQMASLLSKGSQRMMFHQPLKFTVPHGFARNVGLSSSRGYCSTVGTLQPALNGPVRMMAQMYAKPLGSLPVNAQKLSDDGQRRKQGLNAQRQERTRPSRRGDIKKRSASSRLSSSTIKAFLNRAALAEQQHQILSLCHADNSITTATAISLAKAAGKTASELSELPKLQASESCPTNVDMCFLLDASPLWHLDTMVAALHTDSLRAPKELNSSFIENLLEITNAQYQHFMEVSAILQKLVQCPETREISLEGYELRVHFTGTTLFDVTQFLKQLSIDPKSPHFDLEEVLVDQELVAEQYFPQASVNNYYAPSLSDNEPWDDCNSLQSSLLMYADSELSSSVTSFATLDSMPVQDSPWEGAVAPISSEVTMEENKAEQEQDTVVAVDASAIPVQTAAETFMDEDPTSPWTNAGRTSTSVMHGSTDNLNRLSSRILNSAVVSEEYFDEIRGFLDTIEAVHRQSDRIFGPPSPSPF